MPEATTRFSQSNNGSEVIFKVRGRAIKVFTWMEELSKQHGEVTLGQLSAQRRRAGKARFN